MSDDFVDPTETDRLPLSGGQWIDVRHRLSAGDQFDMFDRMVKILRAGEKAELNTVESSRAVILAYVVNWSFTTNGAPVKFSGAALNNLTRKRFAEISKAVEAHDRAVEAEQAEEKKDPPGESASNATSPLPGVAVGGTSGSVN